MSRNKNGTLVSEYGVWCEKFGKYRDFTGGFCGDAEGSEDCNGCPANPNKGRRQKKRRSIVNVSHTFHRGEMR